MSSIIASCIYQYSSIRPQQPTRRLTFTIQFQLDVLQTFRESEAEIPPRALKSAWMKDVETRITVRHLAPLSVSCHVKHYSYAAMSEKGRHASVSSNDGSWSGALCRWIDTYQLGQ